MDQNKCPVDHGHGSNIDAWRQLAPVATTHGEQNQGLSIQRETSSIPRTDSANWVYPSEAQFFAAMARKQHDPQKPDMKTIVPIHNLVNERAWMHVRQWEEGMGGDNCGGIKLVSFQGKPKQLSPRARWNILLGYSAPFDRHDWVVERCGKKIRYVIDFYAGKSDSGSQTPSFFLDCRPALDSFEALKMRFSRYWLPTPSSASSDSRRP